MSKSQTVEPNQRVLFSYLHNFFPVVTQELNSEATVAEIQCVRNMKIKLNAKLTNKTKPCEKEKKVCQFIDPKFYGSFSLT